MAWTVLLGALPVALAQRTYRLTDLGTLGGTSSTGAGINAAGQVVGTSTTRQNVKHAFLWDSGEMIDLGTLGGTTSAAFAINRAGQIAGTAANAAEEMRAVAWTGRAIAELAPGRNGPGAALAINAAGQMVGWISSGGGSPFSPFYHNPFLYADGRLTELQTLGGFAASGNQEGVPQDAVGINASGQWVGWSVSAVGGTHLAYNYFGFTGSGSRVTPLGTLGLFSDGFFGPVLQRTVPSGINDAGAVVGSSYPPSGQGHGFLWTQGTLTDLGTLGGPTSAAVAINASGQVVGWSTLPGGIATHAFAAVPGAMQDLNLVAPAATAGWILTSAVAINDAGQIVCSGTNSAGESHAVVLTPVYDASVRIGNFSVRATVDPTEPLIAGFVVRGDAKSILARAIGPGLQPFLPPAAPLAAGPSLEIFDAKGQLIDANRAWTGVPDSAKYNALIQAYARTGAFPLVVGSADAATLLTLDGVHSAVMQASASGTGLLEIYDNDPADGAGSSAAPRRLVNFSARHRLGTGSAVLTIGFSIRGPGATTVLLRGVGPALRSAPFNLADGVADPRLEVFDQTGQKIAVNDNWPRGLAAAFAQTGAFSLPVGSLDSAVLLTLQSGNYTAQLTGVGNASGRALLEVYEMPGP